MGIDTNKFKGELADRFIALMESERGVQSKLAKSIDKPTSFFSEIKRGNPVNSLHLKAVGIVFGPAVVNELLDINMCGDGGSSPQQSTQDQYEDSVIELGYLDLVKKFKNKLLAKELAEILKEIEEEEPDHLREVKGLLRGELAYVKKIKAVKKPSGPKKTIINGD